MRVWLKLADSFWEHQDKVALQDLSDSIDDIELLLKSTGDLNAVFYYKLSEDDWLVLDHNKEKISL